MATTTTNFGWDIPQSTDLVKDGATAIAALGQDIDTALVDLKGGTTGQVLAKASGTDLDFTWSAAPAGAGLVKIASASFSAVSSVSFANNTFTSTYKDYLVLIDLTNCSANMNIQGRMRTSGTDNSSASYFNLVEMFDTGGGTASSIAQANVTIMNLGYLNSGDAWFSGAYTFFNPQLANRTKIQGEGMGISSGFNLVTSRSAGHAFNANTQFDSFSLIASTGNFTGRYAVYGLEA